MQVKSLDPELSVPKMFAPIQHNFKTTHVHKRAIFLKASLQPILYSIPFLVQLRGSLSISGSDIPQRLQILLILQHFNAFIPWVN